MRNLADRIIAYESGAMETEEEVIALFQELIDSGLAWTLQGSYGRMAQSLIQAGHCTGLHERELTDDELTDVEQILDR